MADDHEYNMYGATFETEEQLQEHNREGHSQEME